MVCWEPGHDPFVFRATHQQRVCDGLRWFEGNQIIAGFAFFCPKHHHRACDALRCFQGIQVMADFISLLSKALSDYIFFFCGWTSDCLHSKSSCTSPKALLVSECTPSTLLVLECSETLVHGLESAECVHLSDILLMS